MSFVPKGAVSSKARALTIIITQNAQNMSHMISTEGQTVLYADALVIGKVNVYIPTDMSEALAQIEAYQPVLYSILMEEYLMTIMYLQVVKYLKETILSFKEALMKKVGQHQAPAMLLHIFHCAVQGWFHKQSDFSEHIPLPNLLVNSCEFCLSKTLIFFPDVLDIPRIDTLSQRS